MGGQMNTNNEYLGYWVFNNTLVGSVAWSDDQIRFYYQHNNDRKLADEMFWDKVDEELYYCLDGSETSVYYGDWRDDKYKTIEIITAPTSDDCKAFLQANATKLNVVPKIRIGNDIRLHIEFSSPLHSSIMLNSVEVYLRNRTKMQADKAEIAKKTKFISRFPLVPTCDCYEPSEYAIHTCGKYGYHFEPANRLIGDYTGFGCNPSWKHIYPKTPNCNYWDYRAWSNLVEAGVVEAYFPAKHQYFCGEYDLIVVAKFNREGYGPENICTATFEKRNVFELVNDESGQSGVITMSVDCKDGPLYRQDVFVNNGVYIQSKTDIDDTNTLTLNLNNGENVVIQEGSRWSEQQ